MYLFNTGRKRNKELKEGNKKRMKEILKEKIKTNIRIKKQMTKRREKNERKKKIEIREKYERRKLYKQDFNICLSTIRRLDDNFIFYFLHIRSKEKSTLRESYQREIKFDSCLDETEVLCGESMIRSFIFHKEKASSKCP